MQLNPTPIRFNSAFCVLPATKCVVVEHSDIRHAPLFNQLYDDAADAGIVLYNPNTDRTTRWHFKEEKRDADNDLEVTIFAPTPETLRQYPGNEGWELHILND